MLNRRTVVDELLELVPRGPKVLSFIEAYLDESGIHDGAAICAIAGYFGGAGQMRKLEKAWLSVLRRFNFPLKEFHAKDLVKNRRHRPMLEALTSAIGEQRKVHPVCFGIVVKDFNSYTLEQRKWFTGATLDEKTKKLKTTGAPSKPYFVPFQNCIKAVTEYAPIDGKAHFFFGLDKPFAEYALSLFAQIEKQLEGPDPAWQTWQTRDRLGRAAFPLASETPQLQAADLYVHLAYRHMLERHAADNWNVIPTGMLADCIKNMRSLEDNRFQDKSCLDDFLRQSREIVGDWDTQRREHGE
jgi:hypothetical protein